MANRKHKRIPMSAANSASAVREHVLYLLSVYSRVPSSAIENDDKLRSDLELTRTELVYLTRSLRSFIQLRRSNARLYVPEVDKSSMTVGKLVELVKTRRGK